MVINVRRTGAEAGDRIIMILRMCKFLFLLGHLRSFTWENSQSDCPVQTAGSPDYAACGFILRQHGSRGCRMSPQLRAAEDCLRRAFVALFLLLSIWKESASEMTKNRKTKFTQRKRKVPSLRHITHNPKNK